MLNITGCVLTENFKRYGFLIQFLKIILQRPFGRIAERCHPGMTASYTHPSTLLRAVHWADAA